SVGLALTKLGIPVWLRDTSSEHLRTALGLGAGQIAPDIAPPPQLVVVAVPPDVIGETLRWALTHHPNAVVTDVGSIKTGPLEQLRARGSQGLARYVGGHPMAGSERSGPHAASAALFDGRPWAVTPHQDSSAAAVDLVLELVRLLGGTAVRLSPDEHDRAVARTSHLPHLLAVLTAARLTGAPPEHLALSGQGVRDVTRVAGSDPAMWQQIVALNSDALRGLLAEVREELDALQDAVIGGDREALGALLARGVAGTRAIPGKHGGPAAPTRSVFVSVPDHPGELARLFADAGASEVNIEDVHIDHDPGRPVGLVELVVDESRAEHLLGSLESRGWVTHR
ncbi:MAG TPA: prephenate dehydrogenase, partial [Nocardioides sp.]|nr:prephenate dehydrogenase [Nocardioides sp.]